MPKIEKPPDGVRPYLFHGVDLDWEGKEHATAAECPWCGRDDGRFTVTVETGTCGCFVCGEKGNVYTFLRKLWDESDKKTNGESTVLAQERGLLDSLTLTRWGCVVSILDGSWLIPGWSPDRKLTQLYKRIRVGDRWELRPTPTLTHALHGLNLWDPKKKIVHVHESWGNALAFWETLGFTKKSADGGVAITGSAAGSLLSSANVVAVANCGAVGDSLVKYLPLFADKDVTLWFDSDHPRVHNGNDLDGAGFAAVKRATQLLLSTGNERRPSSVSWLKWGERGFDSALHSGFDVRDALTSVPDQAGRVRVLADLLDQVEPIPADWIGGRTGDAAQTGGGELQCLPCRSWAELMTWWRKAMKMIEGLERALACSLAAILSTGSAGSQLWIKMIGPPSCIAADTFIGYVIRKKDGRLVNKKGGPIKRLYARFNGFAQSTGGADWDRDVEFFVQSVTDEGKVFRNRIKTVLDKGVKRVYRVTTLTGKTLEATADHELLTEGGYVKLEDLRPGDSVLINPGKPAKRTRKGRVYRQEVFVKNHPNAKVKFVNGVRYQRLRVYQAVYEACQNNMSYEEYVKFLNTASLNQLDALWTVPKGMEIHHKDEDPGNNEYQNLQLVDPGQHRDLHYENSCESVAIYAVADEIVAMRLVGSKRVFDIVCDDPYRNFVAGGIVVHNCGKSTICEALSVNTRHVKALSTIRGFHSGYKEGDGSDNKSLILKIKNKTLVTKDGDTLLTAPNRDQILGEARDLFDKTARSDYRTGMGMDHAGVNMTWILCGTKALRVLDQSELGARFVDVVIMDDIDDDLEDLINLRAAYKAIRNVKIRSNCDPSSGQDPDLLRAMQLTGGYIDWLHDHAQELLDAVEIDDVHVARIAAMGKFVAFMRARPALSKDAESEDRELSPRLVEQFLRLALCLSVVLNKKDVDDEVLRLVRQTALDTARGQTLEIASKLYAAGETGLSVYKLAHLTGHTEDKDRKFLRFLRRIGAAERFDTDLVEESADTDGGAAAGTTSLGTAEGGSSSDRGGDGTAAAPGALAAHLNKSNKRSAWRLTARLAALYEKVVGDV